jgi:hypothetical protein
MEFLIDDPVAQAVTCQRVTLEARAPRCGPLRLRYCRASELDLMVRLAGLRGGSATRTGTAARSPGESQDHIAVYEVTAAPAG